MNRRHLSKVWRNARENLHGKKLVFTRDEGLPWRCGECGGTLHAYIRENKKIFEQSKKQNIFSYRKADIYLHTSTP